MINIPGDEGQTQYEQELEEGEEEFMPEPVVSSYACEDCDYRWEVTFEDEEDEELNDSQYCPMCGSASCAQI